ncbi:exosortase F system-associated protein [Flavobacterium psychrophilum]|uniref:Exosortase F system-associated protein n=5 Tax=Flavobacterium psychrophilum TaxID=96345 RepID=A6H174_FLAPJ|nr:exosortase F system-associated protein [Flavobacterium psychrophilum]AIG30783.1 membrane protein [Flavobacterium psychrophilum]AIG33056.1 membrane protein [Flavobacterium psychrophilum]AIG35213.1 membrane protein [Flavobacterium psychrophilum]AIG37577.1 membrane protein [Flavobacterium psychrophilum]AIG39842.1 membrane protein [Flavobacterium psychrophilum]
MLQKLLNNKLKIIQFVFLVGSLTLVRIFENDLFYDPFLKYFKDENASNYPEIESFKFFLSLIFRYFINATISLALLYVVFKDLSLIKISSVLYILFLVLLMIGFYIVLNFFDESQKTILFYIRRFIIQPIFILLFIPAFYFQKKSE